MNRRALTGVVKRRTIPSAIIAASRVDMPARLAVRARRALGRPGRVELYFAFDDPSSAVAVLDLVERLRTRDAEIALRPVVARGIPGDPAMEAKRRYALVDARRRAARLGLTLGRAEPVDAAATAFLARWSAAAPTDPARARYVVAALERLWFAGDGPIDEPGYADLWRHEVGGEPPTDGAEAVAANERRMRRRGPYDTPAAWLAGHWYFAHDRPDQIAARLDELGWSAR